MMWRWFAAAGCGVFTVGADGELLPDTEVFLSELPVTLQQAIKNKIGGATLGEIDKSGNDASVSYDVEMMGDQAEKRGASVSMALEN